MAQEVFVLDGGFSSQLSRHVADKVDGDPLWTARFLKTNPEAIIKTHLDFLRAGSDIIMTNTYQASVGGFVKHLGITSDEAYGLIKGAVDLAKKARQLYLEETKLENRKILIVGSVGPYGAHLHDASEYSGSYAEYTSKETMKEWHRPRIEALIHSGVDMLGIETIPCEKEAEALMEMLREWPNIKAWLSFSCKDEKRLACGEDFQNVAKKIWAANSGQLVAIGVNCFPPKLVENLFKGINNNKDMQIPLIVYPNSGEKYNSELGWVDKNKCESINTFVQQWLNLGVRFVGGCCRTYAEDIENIRLEVQKWLKRTSN